MNVLFVNTFCGVKSTGKICVDLARKYEEKGYTCRVAYGREPIDENYKDLAYHIGTEIDVRIHGAKARLTDRQGLYSKTATKKFLEWADQYNPDLLWLHNLHGYYLNYEMLFSWIKRRPGMQVKWTLHDCWAFTGHCAYFTMVGCNKWMQQCENCPQKLNYPKSLLWDGSKENYDRKKRAFTGVSKLNIIVPSQWLADLVGKSFLKEYPVEVVYNTVDKSVFKPTPSNFRDKYGLTGKYIILGVASDWDKRKGLDDFIELAQMLDERYVIVLVGLKDKQIRSLPSRVKGLRRTNDASELAAIYSAADCFVNPSLEETFGMTTVEAQACGTDAIVYKRTACEEIVERFGGVAIEPDVKVLYKAITGKDYFEKSSEVFGG